MDEYNADLLNYTQRRTRKEENHGNILRGILKPVLNYAIMKPDRGVRVQIHALLTLEQEGGDWSASRSSHCILG